MSKYIWNVGNYGTPDFYPLVGKTVLLTGSTGLLGTHIATQLSGLVSDLDLDIELYFQAQRQVSEQWLKMTGCAGRIVYANLANPTDCANLPNADVVICAHSYAQPLKFISEPLMALRGAAYGTMALLEKVNVGGRFLYISSSEVYCDCPTDPPYKESDIGAITPYHPRACYIAGKIFGEAMTYLYRQRGISTVAVRPGITYGPGFKRDDQRSWASFVRRAVETKEIRLLDAGQVKRTVCYVSDGMQMLFNILLRGTQPVYNLAGQYTISIAEMAETIAKHAGAKVIYPDADHGVAGTPENLALDGGLYESEFGKQEFVTPEVGFGQTVDWYREAYGNQS